MRGAPQEGHCVVLGQTGLGKSSLVRAWIAAGRRAWPRVLIIDPHREYGAVAVAVRSVEEWADYCAAAGSTWAVAYQGDDIEEALPVVCDAAYALGQVRVVVEEVDWVATPAAIEPTLAHLIKYGRHRQVWVVGVSRRPSEVHRLLTSQARHVVAFGTAEPRDLDYLRAAVHPDYAAQVAALPPLRAAWWDRRDRILRLLTVDPARGQVQQEQDLTAPKQPAVD